jgi:hypothetical protein
MRAGAYLSMMPACVASITPIEQMNEMGIRLAMTFAIVAVAGIVVRSSSPHSSRREADQDEGTREHRLRERSSRGMEAATSAPRLARACL